LSSFLAAITIICTGVAMLYPTVKTLIIARQRSPQALYTVPGFIRTCGALYVPFRFERYYFFVVPLVAAFIKSAFIGFGQRNGTAQAVGLVIVETFVFILTCAMKPHRSGHLPGINSARSCNPHDPIHRKPSY
jgi:hypothetical protein